jgi:hypothetical protein
LSEEICKPFGEEMEIVNREFHTYNTNHGGDTVQKKGVISYSELWKEENLGEFDSLRAVRDFVANCHEQDERIRRLSLERGDDIFKEVMPKELNTVKNYCSILTLKFSGERNAKSRAGPLLGFILQKICY